MNKFSLLKLHFIIINFVAFFSLPLSLIFIGIFELAHLTLGILLLNNLFFIVASWRNIVFKKSIALIIMLTVFVNIIIGIKNHGFNFNSILDTTLLVTFLLKLNIIYYLSKNKEYLNLIVSKIKTYALVCITSASITTYIYYTTKYLDSTYLGLTPTVAPLLSFGLYHNNIGYIIISLILAALSGKRAIILSSIIITILYYFKFNNLSKSKKTLYLFIIILIVYQSLQFDIFKKPIDKVTHTITLLLENKNLTDGAIKARYSEIYHIINDLSLKELPFGKGVGYRYELTEGYTVIKSNYNNAHFTPISFISKYGSILYFFIILLMIIAIRKKTPPIFIVFKLYIISFFIESMFSYLIYNDKIIHFILGSLLSINYNNKQKIHNHKD